MKILLKTIIVLVAFFAQTLPAQQDEDSAGTAETRLPAPVINAHWSANGRVDVVEEFTVFSFTVLLALIGRRVRLHQQALITNDFYFRRLGGSATQSCELRKRS